MTNLEDALVAVEAGADAVGFVFYEKSPRCVSVETVTEIVAKLPESVETVGVFSGEPREVELALDSGVDATQTYPRPLSDPLHAHDADHMSRFNRLKSYLGMPYSTFVGETFAKQNLDGIAAEELRGFWDRFDAFFVDSGNALVPGGTGKTFDWREAAPAFKILNRRLRMVVAGGLNPDNVGEAIRILQPWGVDVVSGVEASPGKKDAEKVRAFVRAVREMDRKVS
jgi:phosphoribosylanthranilate isomerase